LRVTATADFAAMVLAEIVARFVARHPAVEVEMRLTSAIRRPGGRGLRRGLAHLGQPLADSSLVARAWPPSSSRSSPRPFIWRGGRPAVPRELGDTNGW